MSKQDTFDAVVIGSGLGGLTAAALLAKAGRSICVLERNHSLGGAASMFKVGDLTVEASLHQTADPRDPRDPKHRILKELGILDEIDWVPVSPFFSVQGGPVGAPFALPHGFDRAREALASRFPDSRHAIDGMIAAIERIHGGIADLTQARDTGSLVMLTRGALKLRPIIADWRASLDDVLSRQLGNREAVKLALAANLGYYADDPKKLWWVFFAVAQGGYLASGGTYIKGGSRTLSMKLAKVVTRAGGVVRLAREAVAIEVGSDGRPAFVRHVDPKSRGHEERIGTRTVLANCAPSVLTAMLSEPVRGKLQQAYGNLPLSTSLFSAHFGLREPPARFGLIDFSTIVLPEWMTSLGDAATCSGLLAENPAGRLPAFGIANYGALDAGLAESGPTLVSVVGTDRLSNWAGLSRDAEKDRRARWLDAILAELDRHFPGLGGAVTDRMFLNAHSMHNFLNTPDGAIYGFAPLPPERPIWAGIPRSPATPVPGLFLASSFAGGGGFTGAMLAGANAAELADRGRGAATD
ncbi:MAG: phytoene desaturase family protein [Hyphomicrobiaceae bacterium]